MRNFEKTSVNFGEKSENVSKKLYDNDRKYLGSFTSSVIVSIAVNSSFLTVRHLPLEGKLRICWGQKIQKNPGSLYFPRLKEF